MFWTLNDTTNHKLVQDGARIKFADLPIEEARPEKPGFKSYSFVVGFFFWIFCYSTRLESKPTNGETVIYYVKSLSYQRWLARENSRYNIHPPVFSIEALIENVKKDIEDRSQKETSSFSEQESAERPGKNEVEVQEKDSDTNTSSDIDSDTDSDEESEAEDKSLLKPTTTNNTPKEEKTAELDLDAYFGLDNARWKKDTETAVKYIFHQNNISRDTKKLDIEYNFSWNKVPATEPEAIAFAKEFTNLEKIILPSKFTSRTSYGDLSPSRLIELLVEYIHPKPTLVIEKIPDQACLDAILLLCENENIFPHLTFKGGFYSYEQSLLAEIIALWLKVGPFEESFTSTICDLLNKNGLPDPAFEAKLTTALGTIGIKKLITLTQQNYNFTHSILPNAPPWFLKIALPELSKSEMEDFINYKDYSTSSYGNLRLEKLREAFILLFDLGKECGGFDRFVHCLSHYYHIEKLIAILDPSHRKIFLPIFVDDGRINYDRFRKLFESDDILELESQKEARYIQKVHEELNSTLNENDSLTITQGLETLRKAKNWYSNIGAVFLEKNIYLTFTESENFQRSTFSNTRDLVALDAFKLIFKKDGISNYIRTIALLSEALKICYEENQPGNLLVIGISNGIKNRHISLLVSLFAEIAEPLVVKFIEQLLANNHPKQVQLAFRTIFSLPKIEQRNSLLLLTLPLIHSKEQLEWVIAVCPKDAFDNKDMKELLLKGITSESLPMDVVESIVNATDMPPSVLTSKAEKLKRSFELEVAFLQEAASLSDKKYQKMLTNIILDKHDIIKKVQKALFYDLSNPLLIELLKNLNDLSSEIERLRIERFLSVCQKELEEISNKVKEYEQDCSLNFGAVFDSLVSMNSTLNDFWMRLPEKSQDENVQMFFMDVADMKTRLDEVIFQRGYDYAEKAKEKISKIAADAKGALKKFAGDAKQPRNVKVAEIEGNDQALVSMDKGNIYKQAYFQLSLMDSILEQAECFLEYRTPIQLKLLFTAFRNARSLLYKTDQALRKLFFKNGIVKESEVFNNGTNGWIDAFLLKENFDFKRFKAAPGSDNLAEICKRLENAKESSNIALLFNMEKLPDQKSDFIKGTKQTICLAHPDKNSECEWAEPVFKLLMDFKTAIIDSVYDIHEAANK
ncbi:MAG: hypothetical protein WC222_01330 [Parachlamydiales bacterium]|jgi:hypothetical protein